MWVSRFWYRRLGRGRQQLARVVVFTTLNLEPSKENIDHLLNLVQKDWIQRKELIILVWSGWAEKLPVDALRDFLTRLLSDENKDTTEAALSLLDRRLKSFPNETEMPAPFARKSAVEGTRFWDWDSTHHRDIACCCTVEKVSVMVMDMVIR